MKNTTCKGGSEMDSGKFMRRLVLRMALFITPSIAYLLLNSLLDLKVMVELNKNYYLDDLLGVATLLLLWPLISLIRKMRRAQREEN